MPTRRFVPLKPREVASTGAVRAADALASGAVPASVPRGPVIVRMRRKRQLEPTEEVIVEAPATASSAVADLADALGSLSTEGGVPVSSAKRVKSSDEVHRVVFRRIATVSSREAASRRFAAALAEHFHSQKAPGRLAAAGRALPLEDRNAVSDLARSAALQEHAAAYVADRREQRIERLRREASGRREADAVAAVFRTIDLEAAHSVTAATLEARKATPILSPMLRRHADAIGSVLESGRTSSAFRDWCLRVASSKHDANFARASDGVTSLMAAALAGDDRVVRHLLELGATPAQTDHSGMNAAHYAMRGGHSGLSSMLREEISRGVEGDEMVDILEAVEVGKSAPSTDSTAVFKTQSIGVDLDDGDLTLDHLRRGDKGWGVVGGDTLVDETFDSHSDVDSEDSNRSSAPGNDYGDTDEEGDDGDWGGMAVDAPTAVRVDRRARVMAEEEMDDEEALWGSAGLGQLSVVPKSSFQVPGGDEEDATEEEVALSDFVHQARLVEEASKEEALRVRFRGKGSLEAVASVAKSRLGRRGGRGRMLVKPDGFRPEGIDRAGGHHAPGGASIEDLRVLLDDGSTEHLAVALAARGDVSTETALALLGMTNDDPPSSSSSQWALQL
jgi:hypothetical protein